MKHAPNFMPYTDQCEGWVDLKRHKVGKLPIGKKLIVVNLASQAGDIYFAYCVRQEADCSFMKTEDGRPFRITEYSRVRAYSSLFINNTDREREGYKIGNFWLNLHESWLKYFLGDTFRFYALFDSTTKEMCLYPSKDERSTMKWSAVAASLNPIQLHMTDKGYVGG